MGKRSKDIGSDKEQSGNKAHIMSLWDRMKDRSSSEKSTVGVMNKLVKSQGNVEMFNKAYAFFEQLEAKDNAKRLHPKVKTDA